jgi:aryl-alcohol dehydrogenase-like predicted oxidoreductase
VLREIAEVHNVTPSQVAINWLLVQPTVSSVLVGARREEQLADHLASVTWELEPAEIERLTTVSAVRVPYPAWHQRNHANDRPVGVGRAVP